MWSLVLTLSLLTQVADAKPEVKPEDKPKYQATVSPGANIHVWLPGDATDRLIGTRDWWTENDWLYIRISTPELKLLVHSSPGGKYGDKLMYFGEEEETTIVQSTRPEQVGKKVMMRTTGTWNPLAEAIRKQHLILHWNENFGDPSPGFFLRADQYDRLKDKIAKVHDGKVPEEALRYKPKKEEDK